MIWDDREIRDADRIGREREMAELSGLVAKDRVVEVFGGAGVGKTTLVLAACDACARDGALPPPAHVSLAGVAEPREAIERTARALGEPRPSPPPGRVVDALDALLRTAPRAVVWDDLDEHATALEPLVRRFAAERGPSRLVLVARRAILGVGRAYEVKPLAHDEAVRLVRTIEARRGRTLADALADATGGNPLLIRLALADEALPRVAEDAELALRRSVTELARGAGRRVLSLLSAAAAPLDDAEVARLAGKGGRDAIDALRKHLVVAREGPKLAIAQPVAPLVAEVVGEADAATWRALAETAERALAASPADDAMLVVACRARVAIGDPAAALRLLHDHPVARASAPTVALDRVLRAVAAAAPAHAWTALRVLAREQLRASDYEAAARTLDELPRPRTREDAERVALLRAECHVRAGEPEAAQRALDALGRGRKGKKPSEGTGVVLARAELAILRGELAASRAALEKLEARTADVPQLEARRAVEIAASHLYEEQYEETHAWTTRARAAQRAAGIPVEPVVTIVDVHALLGLGDVDRAEEVLAREARGRSLAPMLEIATLVRRGDLRGALEAGDAALATLDKHADLLFRSVLARDLVRAAVGTGDLARAARLLRLAESGADEPGLAVLRPICDAEAARLAEAEGDLPRARRLVARAHAKIPRSPFVAIDRAKLHGEPPKAETGAGAAGRAYASLRAAELALEEGDPARARRAAEAAERFYGGARMVHEVARSRVARAEAIVRLARPGTRDGDELAARAEDTLDACEELAGARGYAPIVVACALVRTALAERRGDLVGAVHGMQRALRAAGDSPDVALARAASRLGIGARAPRAEASRRPYESLVERLGLARPAQVIWHVGPRAYLAARDDAPPEDAACVVDADARTVASNGASVELPEQRVALLCALAGAGDGGATLEDLFAAVWRGVYHPLRHRNAVYVALTRLKDSLAPLGREVRVAHAGDRYRLAGARPVAVRRLADRDALRAIAERASAPA